MVRSWFYCISSSPQTKIQIMLQNQNITKIEEIKTLFKSKWLQPEFIDDMLKVLNFKKICIGSKFNKEGISFSDLFRKLLVLPGLNHETSQKSEWY